MAADGVRWGGALDTGGGRRVPCRKFKLAPCQNLNRRPLGQNGLSQNGL
eukprot:CAMPEP_0179242450 /NCGR_PEP_ID=MMETSP0797-20121207/17026_1 /TAXON_ID=47934 /ORGANISM="Dinophysis acuminata, Strain DAEP01" /LENGTH=48 /DNA_ID= /DNA_START= /DNA_END= /DNA_ORIENTATION=